MASGNALKIRRNEITTRKKKSKFTRKNSLEPVVSDHLQSTCFPPVTKEKKKKNKANTRQRSNRMAIGHELFEFY